MKLLIKNFYTPELRKLKEMFGEPCLSYNFDPKTGRYRGLKHFKTMKWCVGSRIGDDNVVYFRYEEDMLLAAMTFNSEYIKDEE